METQEGKDGGRCCSKTKCCGGKALGVIGLLALGGLGGFCFGRHCPAKLCATPAAAPAQPSAK